jgi:imidazolonepropionase
VVKKNTISTLSSFLFNLSSLIMSILIRNINSLLLGEKTTSALRGTDLGKTKILQNAWLMIVNGQIADWGTMANCPERADEIIDANDGWVLPAFVDSHTHLVFAAAREQEFVYRLQGLSYHEIAAKGGGILNSAGRLQETPEEKLLEDAHSRLLEVISYGTGAIEIKSGYGLTVDAELKMLRVIRRLKEISPIPIKASFLGAHAMPMEYKENREAYIKLITHKMLPTIAAEGLADYIDVFCEKGFYSVEETDLILEAGSKFGLTPKIHSNQFNSMGGIECAIKHHARSVDHLEVLNEMEIEQLKNSDTIATLLPTAPFFLNDPHFPPAKKLIDSGVAIALASDFNPGTTPSGNMQFVLSLACIKLRMLPEEAFNAATINGAFALDLGSELGSIEKGKKANLMITRPMPSLAFMPYYFGANVVERMIIS